MKAALLRGVLVFYPIRSFLDAEAGAVKGLRRREESCMVRLILCFAIASLLSGCAAIAPFSSLVSAPTGPPPLQVHEETQVKLAQDNFVLIKTNVVGRSHGFSLLGLITIYPATLNKAMNRLYVAAEMHSGEPQTIAHLVVEQTSSYWILFGIPEVDARADIVQFKPPPPRRPPPQPRPPAQGAPSGGP